jgi:hypothetical protein
MSESANVGELGSGWRCVKSEDYGQTYIFGAPPACFAAQSSRARVAAFRGPSCARAGPFLTRPACPCRTCSAFFLTDTRFRTPPPGDSRTLINHLSVPGVRAHVLFANYTDAACLRRVAHRDCCSERACTHADDVLHPQALFPHRGGPATRWAWRRCLIQTFSRARDSISSACMRGDSADCRLMSPISARISRFPASLTMARA